MRMTGLEPARRGHQILSLARLPIPPHPHANCLNNILYFLHICQLVFYNHLFPVIAGTFRKFSLNNLMLHPFSTFKADTVNNRTD